MELQDIKTIDDMKKQAEVYGVIAEQVADNLQDLKKLVAKKKNIGIYNELLDKLDKAQHELYQASIELANGED